MAHGLAHGPRPRFCPHPEKGKIRGRIRGWSFMTIYGMNKKRPGSFLPIELYMETSVYGPFHIVCILTKRIRKWHVFCYFNRFISFYS